MWNHSHKKRNNPSVPYDYDESFLRIWPHLLKKSLMENFIFCAVFELIEQWFFLVIILIQKMTRRIKILFDKFLSQHLRNRPRLGKIRSKIKHLLDIERKFTVYKPRKSEQVNSLHHQPCKAWPLKFLVGSWNNCLAVWILWNFDFRATYIFFINGYCSWEFKQCFHVDTLEHLEKYVLVSKR